MAADSSFDVVSKYDRQEVDNAVNQASKEISQRYDFRGVDASIELAGETITVTANSAEEPKASGKLYKLVCPLREGLSQENAKKITKAIRESFPKGVKALIQGDEVRVSSKSRDDLQAVIAMLKELDIDAALQFTNYR